MLLLVTFGGSVVVVVVLATVVVVVVDPKVVVVVAAGVRSGEPPMTIRAVEVCVVVGMKGVMPLCVHTTLTSMMSLSSVTVLALHDSVVDRSEPGRQTTVVTGDFTLPDRRFSTAALISA